MGDWRQGSRFVQRFECAADHFLTGKQKKLDNEKTWNNIDPCDPPTFELFRQASGDGGLHLEKPQIDSWAEKLLEDDIGDWTRQEDESSPTKKPKLAEPHGGLHDESIAPASGSAGSQEELPKEPAPGSAGSQQQFKKDVSDCLERASQLPFLMEQFQVPQHGKPSEMQKLKARQLEHVRWRGLTSTSPEIAEAMVNILEKEERDVWTWARPFDGVAAA